MTIETALNLATDRLHIANSTSARLDAEILLAFTLRVDRTWLHAHNNQELHAEEQTLFEDLITQRTQHYPIAYIVGQREFYGREFTVTPDVLIPRPETEALIEFVLNGDFLNPTILDVGTGSGAIAITLAAEMPNAIVTASDISPVALEVARKNAVALDANVAFVQSDLLTNVSGQYTIIVANLPYVDHTWPVSPDTIFEPELALFAADHGLALIKRLIVEAKDHLLKNGVLLLELDTRQIPETIHFATQHDYRTNQISPFALALYCS